MTPRSPRYGAIRTGRKSKREILSANNAADRFYAGIAGIAPQFQSEIAEVRAKRTPTTGNGLLEADVLEDSLAALRAHPNVAFAWRLQSGVFIDGNRHVRVGFKGMPDICGMLRCKDTNPPTSEKAHYEHGKFFGIEIKRERGGITTPEQQETLDRIRKDGGLAGVAHSAAEAISIIEA